MERRTIGKFAKLCGVGLETIRFYERKGLIPRPKRKDSGFRMYRDKDLKRMHFILMAKRHGFTLNEIKHLLDLKVNPNSTCEDVRREAEEKIQVIEQKISELKLMKNALKRLAASCQGLGPAGECPILEAFYETQSSVGSK